jgi:superfamily II DNA or RNA helicase
LARGDCFEAFTRFYLEHFGLMYEWQEGAFPRVDGRPFPVEWQHKLNMAGYDLGVDGLILRRDGSFIAVQSKFRTSQETLTYRELATFWSEAESADFRLVFTNAPAITHVADRKRGHLLVCRDDLESLDDAFWDALHQHFSSSGRSRTSPRKQPRPYQERALLDLESGFRSHARGKLIAACGIGKTLIALWLAEGMNAQTVLFVAPNLQLIRQTLREWAQQASSPFGYVAVCSDDTVALGEDELLDSVTGFDIPTTTDPSVVESFLSRGGHERRIVFSTYQSLNVVVEGIRRAGSPGFELGIFDEAHKTAGLDADTGFGVGLRDDLVPIKFRLFMTATERLYSPRLQASAIERDRVVFSMDNESLYGPAFHRLSFSTAIREGIISDYRVVVAVLAAKDIQRVIQTYEFVINTDEAPEAQRAERTQQVLALAILKKVNEELGARKFVSYHNSVREARSFSHLIEEDPDTPLRGFTVNGAMSSNERGSVIRSFEAADSAALTNARCLVEGVDIPIIDSVYFVSPKNSLIDIVQATGRALRRPYGDESNHMAYVVIPIVVNADAADIDVSSSEFDRLYNVLQALRDQDDAIADEIDQINLEIATGGAGSRHSLRRVIHLLVPGEISVDALEHELSLRIAEVNARQSGTYIPTSTLGAGERGSAIERVFRTMGDYTPAKYQESLVDPTLSLFPKGKGALPRGALKVNNNNVGHAEKLGVIMEVGRGQFELTPIGRSYRKGDIDFHYLFKNQMLRYRDTRVTRHAVWPYRLMSEVMLRLGSLNYLDFLYGPYVSDFTWGVDAAIGSAEARIRSVRDLGVRPNIANERNRSQVLEALADATGVEMSERDVFTDRTTTFNQFRYFRRHLELFDDVFVDEDNTLRVIEGQSAQLEQLLERSSPFLNDSEYGLVTWL